MKKTILTAALLACFCISQAQTHKTKKQPEKKSETPAKTLPELVSSPGLIYHLNISGDDMTLILNSAINGFVPWLHTTATPMNAEEQSKKIFIDVFNKVAAQLAVQKKHFDDSVAKTKPDTSKTK